MSSFGDKVKGFFSMDNMYEEDYEEYDDYDEYDSEPEPVKPARAERKVASRSSERTKDFNINDEDEFVADKPSKPSRRTSRQSKVVQMNNERARNIKAQIFTIRPTSLEDSKEIVDTLLAGKAIILNFEGTNTDLAQRIIDSVSGACCAVDGTLKKVSGYIYIVSPVNIELYGEYMDVSSSNSYDFKGNRYQY